MADNHSQALTFSSFNSFIFTSQAWIYVAFAAAIIRSLICVPPPNFFFKLAYKCLRQSLCSTLSNSSSKTGIRPCKKKGMSYKTKSTFKDDIQKEKHI